MNIQNATGVYLIIFNLTKNKVLSKDAKLATSFLDQLLGLLNPDNPRSLVFKTRFGIHTFGVKEMIDVLVLDKDNKVIKIKRSLKQNRVFFWPPKYFKLIELPTKTIKSSKTQLGDQIIFKKNSIV